MNKMLRPSLLKRPANILRTRNCNYQSRKSIFSCLMDKEDVDVQTGDHFVTHYKPIDIPRKNLVLSAQTHQISFFFAKIIHQCTF